MSQDLLAPSALDPDAKRRSRNQLIAFFGLTFLMTWGLGVVIIFFKPQLEQMFGPLGPLNRSWIYTIAVCSPTIVAVTLSLVVGGLPGLKALLGGLVRPARLKWIALAIFIYPAVLLAWGLLERALGVASASTAIDIKALLIGSPVMLFTTLMLFTDPGGLGEEAGWRGFALPRLLNHFQPAAAGLILGVIWLIWHVPAFFSDGLNQASFNFGWFALAIVSLTLFMTWIFVHTNGNWLLAGIIPHTLFNLFLDAHVFKVAPKPEAIALGVLAVGLLAGFGPTLGGWRRRAVVVA